MKTETLAEQSVLGGLMLNTSAYDAVAEILVEDDFSNRQHRLMFRAIGQLAAKGKDADIVTIADTLEGEVPLDYVGQLAANTPSSANVVAYAESVRDAAMKRRIVTTTGEIKKLIEAPGGAREKLDQAEAMIGTLATRYRDVNQSLIRPLVKETLSEIEAQGQAKGGLLGLSTGFRDLDNMTLGLQGGDLIVVAGRPSMGKTALALSIAEHVSIHDNVPTLIDSLEMTAHQLVIRMLASQGRLNSQRLRMGRLSDEDWAKLVETSSKVQEAPILIDDSGGMTIFEIRSRARRAKRERNIGLLIIDYLQLMSGSDNRENRATEIGTITRGLKTLAKELQIPIIALSQLNRNLENRGNRRPMMSDLRESGDIEQDADTILFLYRDEVYDERSPAKGIAEVIIGKQRNGPTGVVRLTFLAASTKFASYVGPDPFKHKPSKPVKEWRGGFDDDDEAFR